MENKVLKNKLNVLKEELETKDNVYDKIYAELQDKKA